MEGGSLSPAEFYGRFKGSLISPRLSPDRPAGSPLLGRRSPLHRGINGTISLDVSLDRDERFYCLFPIRSFDILLFLFAAIPCFSNHVHFSRVGRSRSRV